MTLPHYHAELCGGGPCDGLMLGVSLDDVEGQELFFAVATRTHLAQIRRCHLGQALDLVPAIAVYRLTCVPTRQGLLRFDFAGRLEAPAREAR